MALMASTTRCAARWTGTESTASRRQLRQAHQCGAMSASGHVRSSRTSLSRLTARGSRSPPRRVMSTSVACTSNAVTRRPASAFTRSPPLPVYLFTEADSPGAAPTGQACLGVQSEVVLGGRVPSHEVRRQAYGQVRQALVVLAARRAPHPVEARPVVGHPCTLYLDAERCPGRSFLSPLGGERAHTLPHTFNFGVVAI